MRAVFHAAFWQQWPLALTLMKMRHLHELRDPRHALTLHQPSQNELGR